MEESNVIKWWIIAEDKGNKMVNMVWIMAENKGTKW